jgi:glycerophosphoryl diester phosphodiesterase
LSRLGTANPLTRISFIVRGVRLRPPRRSLRAAKAAAIRVIGHRGKPKQRCENTIESFAAAVEAGADAVETDICATRDGHFVLWHDADPNDRIALARQLGGECLFSIPDVPALTSSWRRKVSRLDLTDFRAHYGYTVRGGGSHPRIPIATLDDLFVWARRESRLRDVCLDVKLAPEDADHAPRLFRTVADFMRSAGGASPRFHLLSPQLEIARIFLGELAAGGPDGAPDAYADFELPGVLRFAQKLRARRVSMGAGERSWWGFRGELARVIAARNRGRIDSVIVWTINSPVRLKELVAWGVDGVITDEVELLRGFVSEVAGQEEAAGSASRGERRPSFS